MSDPQGDRNCRGIFCADKFFLSALLAGLSALELCQSLPCGMPPCGGRSIYVHEGFGVFQTGL